VNTRSRPHLKHLLLAVGIVVVLGGGIVAIFALGFDDSGGRGPEIEGASVVKCDVDDQGRMVAEVEVTNRSAERSDYFIQVAFQSRDGVRQLKTGIGTIEALPPGETATDRADSFTEPPERFRCELLKVTRHSNG